MPNIDTVDPAFNNKVIYAKGLAKTRDVLTDSQFYITTTAISSTRDVQFYQWVESSKTKKVKNAEGKEQNITTFTYAKEWVSAPVDSSQFHQRDTHMNSVILQTSVEDQKWLAKKVSFGAYSLPQFMITSISNNQPLPLNLTEEQINQINQQLTVLPITNIENDMVLNSQEVVDTETDTEMVTETSIPDTQEIPASDQQKRVHVQENSLYLGYKQMPQIGDIKIKYTKTSDTNISLIAQVNDNTFAPYLASNGNQI